MQFSMKEFPIKDIWITIISICNCKSCSEKIFPFPKRVKHEFACSVCNTSNVGLLSTVAKLELMDIYILASDICLSTNWKVIFFSSKCCTSNF